MRLDLYVKWRLVNLGVFREILSLPRVSIRLWGDVHCAGLYRELTRRHPRYGVIQKKAWGVALLPLDETFAQYLQGGDKVYLRRKRKRCLREGYRFSSVRPSDYIDEILAINASMDVRQGKAMKRDYLNAERVREYFDGGGQVFGVFDANQALRAYAHVLIAGEVAVLARLLGHGAELEKGIMYLCLSEVVRELSASCASHGQPTWLMYDTMFGASPGLRYFKERLGFRPYKVSWNWIAE